MCLPMEQTEWWEETWEHWWREWDTGSGIGVGTLYLEKLYY